MNKLKKTVFSITRNIWFYKKREEQKKHSFALLHFLIQTKSKASSEAEQVNSQHHQQQDDLNFLQLHELNVKGRQGVPLWLLVWQVYNPRPRLRKAQGAELKLGDSCRNGKPVSLNIDPLKSQLVHSPTKTLFTHALSHCRLNHLSTGPSLTECCLYTWYNNT